VSSKKKPARVAHGTGFEYVPGWGDDSFNSIASRKLKTHRRAGGQVAQ